MRPMVDRRKRQGRIYATPTDSHPSNRITKSGVVQQSPDVPASSSPHCVGGFSAGGSAPPSSRVDVQSLLLVPHSPPLCLTLSSGEAAYRRAKFAPAGEMRSPSFDTALTRLLRMRASAVPRSLPPHCWWWWWGGEFRAKKALSTAPSRGSLDRPGGYPFPLIASGAAQGKTARSRLLARLRRTSCAARPSGGV